MFPLNPEKWFRDGNRFLEAEDFDNAIKSFTMAIESDRSNRPVGALYNRALSYSGKTLRDASKQNSETEARDFAHKHLRLAVADLTRAIEIVKTDGHGGISLADLYSTRGGAYSLLEESQMAIDDLGQVIRLTPFDSDVYVLRGQEFLDTGDPELAINDLTRAISILPKGDRYLIRAWAHFESGNMQQASADFERAIKMEPETKTIRRGNSFSKDSRWEAFVNHFLKTHPGL